jgi:aryl-alcohol dehydrogenase-like predicted oxidoreductase
MNNRRNFIKTAIAGTAAAGLARVSGEAAPEAPDQVDRRPLGRIGTPVSILGLGLGSAFTGTNRNDPEAVTELLEHSLKHGVNYWDTCRGYGPSEEMIGPSVEKHRKDIFLVTKSGGRSYDAFMRDVETSLKLLRTDHIDLMHIWNLPRNADLHEIENGALKAIRKLQVDKVITNFGVTGHSGAKILMEAMKRFDPDAVLTVYPCTRDDNGRYEDELLPLAREKKMGVIAMKTVRKARNADLKGTDLIRYALSLDGIHSAIVGLDTLAHLKDNLAMATDFKPMPAKERAQLHLDVSRAVADVPTPWEQPGYQDGTPA